MTERKTTKELKQIPIEVVSKTNKKLSPTNAMVANTLVKREKAVWIEENKKIMLLKTKQDWKKIKSMIVSEEKRVCYLCCLSIPEDSPATIDHIYPKSKYGLDTRENLRCCCKRCNDLKGNRDLEEFYDFIEENQSEYLELDLEHLATLRDTYSRKYLAALNIEDK